MSEEILINVTPREVRAALLENGVVQELLIERATRRGLISNIYKGKVRRVLPGMQAAFIEIGLERTAFLHESDISRGPDTEQSQVQAPTAGIRDLLTEGGDILVQVLKDPLGGKGARLTTYITLPSRYLVLLPRGQVVGVSARIEDEDERRRLREIMEDIVEPDVAAGFIVRTAAEGASREALRADMLFLEKLWESIQQRAQRVAAGSLVHEDLPLWLRVLRDLLSTEMERVLIDSEQAFARMQEFAAMFIPQMLPMIEHYKGKRPIFDLHNIEDEIQRALDRKVPLKSGGYLMIDQTEAMTTVDVNTGAYVGHRNLEETIFRTNLEASVAIARQLRLRNLGGIIIIDFIDMVEVDHREQVMQELERALQRDPARSQVMEVSALGLVEMTRKRTRESLERMLCEPCPICEGRGFIKTAETVCYEIFREIVRQHRQFEFQELMVMAHQDVVERLLDEESASLAELEEFTGKPIRLQTDAMYSQEQFDVVLM